MQKIPNVGPAVADDLLRLGIRTVEELAQQDPDDLYARLSALEGRKLDPCVRDVFAAVTAYAKGEPARPWWEFSRERKGELR
ncbi:MAG: DUF4332 domain-containing protein [Armatimonadetes bacterium]|nr:MAG: DUF4332 domain-containing protein [Armatimonadota bacterium]